MRALRILSILALTLAASAANAAGLRYAEPVRTTLSETSVESGLASSVYANEQPGPAPGQQPLEPNGGIEPILGPDPDWDLECGGASPVHQGDLTIVNAFDSALYRCVRWVTGKLTIDTANGVTALTLPFVERVDGDLDLEGAVLPKARLPRLDDVGGRITIDQRYGGTRFLMPSLTSHPGRLKVYAATATKLTDIGLQTLGTLELYWYPNSHSTQQGPFTFSGLSDLATVGRVEVDLGQRGGYAASGFLASLTDVTGSVDFEADWLFGLEAVQQIGGNLLVHTNDYYGGATGGLASLEAVGGDFDWSGYLTSLSGLTNLQTIGGELNLESTQLSSLSGLENLGTVGSLRIHDNPSLSSISALNGLGFTGPDRAVRITYNYPLKNCSASTTANTFVGNDPPQIYGNASGTCITLRKSIYYPIRRF